MLHYLNDTEDYIIKSVINSFEIRQCIILMNDKYDEKIAAVF